MCVCVFGNDPALIREGTDSLLWELMVQWGDWVAASTFAGEAWGRASLGQQEECFQLDVEVC